MTARILVVDDEKNIRLFLEKLLEGEGYTVVTAASTQSALERVAEQTFELALLDINLGRGGSGIDILHTIATQYPNTAVILLTGQGTLDTAVEALRQGAYDYLFKPCQANAIRASVRHALTKQAEQRHQQQLLTRLEANLRHTLAEIETITLPENTPDATDQPLKQGRIAIDPHRYIATIDSHALDLSPIEFSLLLHLVEQAPHVVPPQQLVRAIHEYNVEETEASTMIRSHIYRLRQKIRQIIGKDEVIRTVRGVGYALNTNNLL